MFKIILIILRTIIFMVLVPGTALLYVPYEIVTSAFDTTFYMGVFRYSALIPWLSGISIVSWCVWDFMFKGKGTPAPIDPPKELVVSGLYKYVRNPMYIGVLLILSGHILWFGSLLLILYAAGTFVVFYLFVLFYEEPHLQKVFGDSYRLYLQKIPRWIPRARK